jgi:hypothetical protein
MSYITGSLQELHPTTFLPAFQRVLRIDPGLDDDALSHPTR